MIWTKAQPKEVGYYWYRHSRDKHEPTIVRIVSEEQFGVQNGRDLYVRISDRIDDVNFVENYDGEWAGPIRKPFEP